MDTTNDFDAPFEAVDFESTDFDLTRTGLDAPTEADTNLNVGFLFGDNDSAAPATPAVSIISIPDTPAAVPSLTTVLSTLSFTHTPSAVSSPAPAAPAVIAAPANIAPVPINPDTLPSLPSIDHPRVRRIAANRYVFFNPTVGIFPANVNEALSTHDVAVFCAHNRRIRALSDVTAEIPNPPYGYSRIANLFNNFATGPHRFARWSVSQSRYITDGTTVTPQMFRGPPPSRYITDGTTVTPQMFRGPPPVNPDHNGHHGHGHHVPAHHGHGHHVPAHHGHGHHGHGNHSHALGIDPLDDHAPNSKLFRDMLLVAAAAETQRRKNGTQYFTKRSCGRKSRSGAGQHPRHHNAQDHQATAGPSSAAQDVVMAGPSAFAPQSPEG
ncbi:hypothetical protein CVT25_009444, partial [Psilocybe cyanescens]